MSNRVGVMECKVLSDYHLSKMKPPYIVQPKLNGDRCRSLVSNTSCALVSSQNNPRYFMNHITDELIKVKNTFAYSGYDYIHLDGELYSHGMTHREIRSIVSRTVNPHPDWNKIEYHIFDFIATSAGYLPRETMEKRLTHLHYINTIIGDISPVKIVETYTAQTKQDIWDYLRLFISQGYEGIIVRDKDSHYIIGHTDRLLKWKPTQTMTCLIDGFQEEVSKDGEPKGILGALQCLTPAGVKFTVAGFRHKEKMDIWNDQAQYYHRQCLVKYNELTEYGAPISPVYKGMEV